MPESDPRFDGVQTLKDVNPHTVKEIQHFLETYKSIDKKIVEITGIEDREAAYEAVHKGLKLYQEKFPSTK